MQYILNQSEYDEYILLKTQSSKVNQILKRNYDKENLCFNFDEDTYRMLMLSLGKQFGTSYTVNINGTISIIFPDHETIQKTINELNKIKINEKR